ncbi:MAG: hypothetical protein JWQ23_499 [Herminiimonas sp.]|jgi:hypothetical protein|nr:hypothetical protein [Herminiimonas sp.]
MKRMTAALAFACLAGPALADELRFDLGEIEAPACPSTEWKRNTPSGAPVQENKYYPRQTRLFATVIAAPSGESEEKTLQECGEQSRTELSEARSATNITLFSKLFEDFYRRCAGALSPSLRIYKVVVDYEGKCVR